MTAPPNPCAEAMLRSASGGTAQLERWGAGERFLRILNVGGWLTISSMLVFLICLGRVSAAASIQDEQTSRRSLDLEAEETRILELDRALSKAVEGRDREALVSMLAEPVWFLRERGVAFYSSGAWFEYLEVDGPRLSWQPLDVRDTRAGLQTDLVEDPEDFYAESGTLRTSQAGDLGYSLNEYYVAENDAAGQPRVLRGYGLSVWERRLETDWSVL